MHPDPSNLNARDDTAPQSLFAPGQQPPPVELVPIADKPCYYYYHYHYRSDRPLDKSQSISYNMVLLKLRKITFHIFVSCHFIN